MSDDADAGARFRRIPRAATDRDIRSRTERDCENLIAELTRMRRRIDSVCARGRSDFFDEDDETSFLAAQAIIINFEDAANRRIPQTLKDRFADVPWRSIAGTRNLLAHDYRSTSKGLVWAIVSTDLPALVDRLLADLKG